MVSASRAEQCGGGQCRQQQQRGEGQPVRQQARGHSPFLADPAQVQLVEHPRFEIARHQLFEREDRGQQRRDPDDTAAGPCQQLGVGADREGIKHRHGEEEQQRQDAPAAAAARQQQSEVASEQRRYHAAYSARSMIAGAGKAIGWCDAAMASPPAAQCRAISVSKAVCA